MTTDGLVATTIEHLRNFVRSRRQAGRSIGLVPTMGALHEGHLSLVKRLKDNVDEVIVTIFVNPAQFGPKEDFDKYPRQLSNDLEKLKSVEADLVFAPCVDEIYPKNFATTISVAGPAQAGLEDRFRPTHFTGVATIVAKLLIQAQAEIAIFGEKDFQQLLVIRQLARDLDIPTRIFSGPTLRESDGLAMSSRNVYLSPSERAIAPLIYQTLLAAARDINSGEKPGAAIHKAQEALQKAGFVVDYVEARCAETLLPLTQAHAEPIRLLVAANIGKTRLIDNIAAT